MRALRRRFRWPVLVLVGVPWIAGCGWTQKIAVGSMVPILENTAAAARERSDLETVGMGYAGNLLLLDGLIRTEPNRRELLELGSYLYFGYGLGFVERDDPAQAGEYYAIGRDYGLRALDRNGGFRKGRHGSFEEFRTGLEALGRHDVRALAWTCANWGRWLSLNLDTPAAMVQMPRVEAALDRLLEIDPEFERGLPYALRGAYDAMRPAMFGGDPERAKGEFEAALRISEKRMLLYQVFYAEFYCRQVLDEDCFVGLLDAVVAAPDTLLPDSRLLNEIARERALALREMRSEWF